MIWKHLLAPSCFSLFFPEPLLKTMIKIVESKKARFTPEDIRPFVLDGDENDRTIMPVKLRTVKRLNIDQPGMCQSERPWETIELDDLKLSVPSEDVFLFILQLQEIPRLSRGKDSWYEIKAFAKSLAVTVRQHGRLVRELKAILPRALRRNERFQRKFERDRPGSIEMMAKIKVGTHAMSEDGLVALPGALRPN